MMTHVPPRAVRQLLLYTSQGFLPTTAPCKRHSSVIPLQAEDDFTFSPVQGASPSSTFRLTISIL